MQEKLVRERNDAVRKAEMRREADLRKLERKLDRLKTSEEEKETEYREVGRKIIASEASTAKTNRQPTDLTHVPNDSKDPKSPEIPFVPPLRLGKLPPLKRAPKKYSYDDAPAEKEAIHGDTSSEESDVDTKDGELSSRDSARARDASESAQVENYDEKVSWKRYFDEDAQQWYEYCDQTGESKWCAGDNEESEVDTENFDVWEVCIDEEGNEFFYNETTGMSQWEDPREGHANDYEYQNEAQIQDIGDVDKHNPEWPTVAQGSDAGRPIRAHRSQQAASDWNVPLQNLSDAYPPSSARSLGSLSCAENIWDNRVEFVKPRSAWTKEMETPRAAWTSERIPSFVRQGYLRDAHHHQRQLQNLERRAVEAERRAAEEYAWRTKLEQRIAEAERAADIAKAREESAFRRAAATAATQAQHVDRARMEERVSLTARSYY